MLVNEPFVNVLGCFDVDVKNKDVNVSLLFDFVVIVNGKDVVVLEGFPTIFVDIDFFPVVLVVVIFLVDVFEALSFSHLSVTFRLTELQRFILLITKL